MADLAENASINARMVAVTQAIGAIAKDRETTSGARYSFRGIDDVLDAIHEPLVEFGVTPYPKVVSVERDERQGLTDDGKPRFQSVVTLTLGVRFVGLLGDEQYAEATAEAQDYGDKATAKAESVAYRTIMIQVFSIPVSDPNVVDHETENDDRSARTPDLQRRVAQVSRGARRYIDVPFKDKDAARAAGGRWDAEAKRWWIPADADPAKFSKWIDDEEPALFDVGVDDEA